MLPPPQKYQPTNTLTKRVFVSFPNTLKLYYTLQNTCIQDTHSARNTLISSVWDVLRRYTCVQFPNSYGSLNISSSGLRTSGDLPNILGKVGRVAMGFGAALAICCHHHRNTSQRIRSRNAFLCHFPTLWSCIIHYKILVYKTHTVLETLLYRVFGTSSDDTHASSFRIAMAVWTFPAVVW